MCWIVKFLGGSLGAEKTQKLRKKSTIRKSSDVFGLTTNFTRTHEYYFGFVPGVFVIL